MIGPGSDKKCKGENARADCLSRKPEDPFDGGILLHLLNYWSQLATQKDQDEMEISEMYFSRKISV